VTRNEHHVPNPAPGIGDHHAEIRQEFRATRGGDWNGQWKTIQPGTMSVCGCVVANN